MKLFQTLAQAFLLAAFALLPFADLKITVAGIPVYLLEALILGALSSFLLILRSLPKENRFSLDPLLVLGGSLFLLGAFASFFVNPLSLTGWGMMKAWFFFPLLGAFLIAVISSSKEAISPYFASWMFGILLAAAVSANAFFSGALTFDGRLALPYSSPNFLAIILSPGVLIASFFLLKELRKGRRWLVSSFLAGVLLSLCFFLFLTHSYGAWLGATLSLFLFFLLAFPGERRMALQASFGAAFVLASLLFFFEGGSEKWRALVTLDERSSLSSRFMIWESAGTILSDRPFLGIGVGNFQSAYLSYQPQFPPYLEWAVPQPHNLFLAVWLQAGIAGFLGFLLLIGRSLFLLAVASRAEDDELRLESVLLLSLWCLVLVYGVFDTPYFKNDLSFLFWALIGLSALQAKRKAAQAAR